MAIRMIGFHLSRSQRMLDACANVHARRGSPQEPPLYEGDQDETARIGVEIPESPRLCLGKLQARHFLVLALNSSNEWRQSAQSPLRRW